MSKATISIIISILVVAEIFPAWAHSPYYTRVEKLSVPGRDNVSIKILNGDGIFVADPKRAVVVDRSGTLLAASPVSETLTLLCTGGVKQRTCIVYDGLLRTIHEPKPDLWREARVVEEAGRPIEYPEYGTADFGFAARRATTAETVRAEFAGAIQSWPLTAIAIAWWMLFWLTVIPVGERLLGSKRRPGLASIVLRLLSASLMAALTAYGWSQAPYSWFYFAVASTAGACLAWLMKIKRERQLR